MDRILLKITLLLLAGTGGIRCVSQDNSQIYRNYNTEIAPFPFFAPDNSIELHKDLNEISGLSYVEEGILAAVEDEHGRIYLLDSEKGRILKTYKFEGRGDFEAIEYVDGIYYAMESNGDLFSVTLRNGETEAVEKYDTGLKKANDVEGLGIFKDKLIAACKGDGEIDGNDREGKTAYLLDDEFDVRSDNPFEIKEDDIQKLIDLRSPEVKIRDFDPSGIAVDPLTGRIWVISADLILCILNEHGKLMEVVLLDRKIYRQPEGICFDPNGNLYISSEADGKKPMLFRFVRIDR